MIYSNVSFLTIFIPSVILLFKSWFTLMPLCHNVSSLMIKSDTKRCLPLLVIIFTSRRSFSTMTSGVSIARLLVPTCKVCTIGFERLEASPLNVYSPSAIIGFSLLNSILMERFLKQSFAQICLKETDNGKLHQFNY